MEQAEKLPHLISETLERLPYEKQLEVYDSAAYLRSRIEEGKDVQSNLGTLTGILEGPSDLASGHDDIYD